MNVVLLLIGLVVLAAAAVRLFIAAQGDAEFEFQVTKRTQFAVSAETDDSIELTCRVPFVNKGSQDGTIMDAYPRTLLPYEQFDKLEAVGRLELEAAPRIDNYFEAVIIPKGTGQAVNVTLRLTDRSGEGVKSALAAMVENRVDLPVDIVYQIVARSDWYIHKNRLVLTSEELSAALAAKGGR